MYEKWVAQWSMMVKSNAIFKSWGPFRIHQLISTAHFALFDCNWAGLAMLVSWWILKRPPGFEKISMVLIFSIFYMS
jgi:hypothetical protein